MTQDYEEMADGGQVSGLRAWRRSQGRDHIQQLDSFYGQGFISEVLYLVSIGKEASVYCCRGGVFLAGRQASTSRIADWGPDSAGQHFSVSAGVIRRGLKC